MKKYKLNDFVDFTKAQAKLDIKKKDLIKEKTQTHFSRYIIRLDTLGTA